jgi:hypothetical protein
VVSHRQSTLGQNGYDGTLSVEQSRKLTFPNAGDDTSDLALRRDGLRPTPRVRHHDRNTGIGAYLLPSQMVRQMDAWRLIIVAHS